MAICGSNVVENELKKATRRDKGIYGRESALRSPKSLWTVSDEANDGDEENNVGSDDDKSERRKLMKLVSLEPRSTRGPQLKNFSRPDDRA